MSLKNIIIVGATGNVGVPVVKGLLERKSDFTSITALTHNDPNDAKFADLKKQGVHVVQADYANQSSLKAALKGQDALIIAIGAEGFDKVQRDIIEAAIDVGVKRIYPSEFGLDYTIPKNQEEIFADKVNTQQLLIAKAKEGKTSYTFVSTAAFADWGLVHGVLGFDVKKRHAILVDGGTTPLSATHTTDIGRFVAASLVNSAASHNKSLRVESFHATPNDFLAALEKHTGSKFTVEHKTSQQLRDEAQKHKAAGEIFPYVIKTIQGLFFDGRGLHQGLENGLFPEVKTITLDETVKQVVHDTK